MTHHPGTNTNSFIMGQWFTFYNKTKKERGHKDPGESYIRVLLDDPEDVTVLPELFEAAIARNKWSENDVIHLSGDGGDYAVYQSGAVTHIGNFMEEKR